MLCFAPPALRTYCRRGSIFLLGMGERGRGGAGKEDPFNEERNVRTVGGQC